MSHENPNFISSKDIKTDPETFKETILIADESRKEEVEKNRDVYEASTILESYNQKIQQLHNITIKINTYLEAKEKVPEISAKLSNLMTTRPAEPLLIQNALRELEDYERKIRMFEKGKVPEKVLEDALAVIVPLEEKLDQYQKLDFIAQEHPEQN